MNLKCIIINVAKKIEEKVAKFQKKVSKKLQSSSKRQKQGEQRSREINPQLNMLVLGSRSKHQIESAKLAIFGIAKFEIL